MSQKPILRWTVGNVSDQGLLCFRMAVKKLFRLYEDTFDYYCLHNSIDVNRLQFLKDYPITFIDQTSHKNDLDLPAVEKNPCWKLYPSRLDINRQEIFLDNDLILYRRLPAIDRFLSGESSFFITEAVARSYGAFNRINKRHHKINTGLFGIPPEFDFAAELNATVKKVNLPNWYTHLDEQGCVANIFEQRKFEFVTLDQVYVCHPDFPYKVGQYGQHFVTLNRKPTAHWQTFLRSNMI